MNRSTACLDWAERLKTGKSIIPPPLYPEQAEKALAIFKSLRIVDAAGSPTFGEACAQWVFDLVASIFGAYNGDTGKREITEWFVMLPKKNSKSSVASGIMITALILNWRQSGEFAVIAPTKEVADNVYNPARDFMKKDVELDTLLHVQNHIKTITHRDSQAMLKVIAADSNTVGGKKSVGTLFEELHLFGKQPNAENMFREAIGGLASRPEGFVIYLTTQSDDQPAGIFAQKLMYARKVRDGEIKDEKFVPIIYEFPEEMIKANEHLDPANFGIVNPNLNYSVDRQFLERELTKAQQEGDKSVQGFLAKHLNVEVGLGLRTNQWAGTPFWEAQGDAKITLDHILKVCDVVTAGIDGGGLDDMLGLGVLGRHAETGDWLHWGHGWIHPIVLQRRKSEAARFRDFEKQGDLTIVENMGEDIGQLAEYIEQLEASGLLDRIGVDQAGIGAVVDALTDEEGPGIELERIVGIPQGWKMVGAIKTAERKLAEGTFHHGARPLMAWTIGNMKAEARGNALIITKQISGSAKIDLGLAMLNAVSLLSMNPKARSKKYEMFFVGS